MVLSSNGLSVVCVITMVLVVSHLHVWQYIQKMSLVNIFNSTSSGVSVISSFVMSWLLCLFHNQQHPIDILFQPQQQQLPTWSGGFLILGSPWKWSLSSWATGVFLIRLLLDPWCVIQFWHTDSRFKFANSSLSSRANESPRHPMVVGDYGKVEVDPKLARKEFIW